VTGALEQTDIPDDKNLPDETNSPSEVVVRLPRQLREEIPNVIASDQQVIDYAGALASAQGPLAVDAERASGYTYSQRAYLVQLRRDGAGSALIDPIAVPNLDPIANAISGTEWILHAATQDLECLRELNLHPQALFDTELAGRLLGREKVGLAGLVESELGEYLEKGHGAANWSLRPLTTDMLRYAALDVELLIELRDSLEQSLKEDGKWQIAQQEFDALLRWQPREQTGGAWRKTSGIHAVRSPRIRATVRELWISRDDLARRKDIAPGRLIPDRAIIAAAQSAPTNMSALLKLKEFNGRGAKKYERVWWQAIERARSLPESELPGSPPRSDSPPPPRTWADKNPQAHDRLEFARNALLDVSEEMNIPLENLLRPDLLRRICWSPPDDGEDVLRRTMSESGARPWQIDISAPIILEAINIKDDSAKY
jgi:ribonuclease D